MDKEKWLEERRSGIGGSDAPAICGISKWKTPYQVWLEKRGGAEPQEDNEPMFWGRTLEPIIRHRYADITHRTVTVPQGIIRNTMRDWLICTPDGITHDGRLVEIKTARSSDGWGEDGSPDIPETYLVQVQHNLLVTKLEIADIPVLFGGQDFRIYEVPADSGLQDLIFDQEAAFWELVKNDIPPEITSFADLKAKFGKVSKAVKVQVTPEVFAAIERLKEVKELAKEEEALKAIIMAYLQEADTLVDGEKILATWKAGKPAKRFDAKALEGIMPEIYKQFLKEGEPSRRLLIK